MAITVAGVLMILSFLTALFSGNMAALSEAALSGCGKAVTVTLSLLGLMCLWGGIMNAVKESGFLDRLGKLLSPLLRRLFPDAWLRGKGIPEIAAAIVANVLGIGNAATPLAVNAMKALADGHEGEAASDDMVTFTVLGTAFPSLLPTTVIALRTAAGSRDPFDILPAVWICSVTLSVFAVLLARGLRRLPRKRRQGDLRS
ncbi:MAG: spore maturation protein A [Clostridia bacterium]|nr:spore maturation protein A [Clostridia bacterium]